jgi:hypothetical protein
MQFLRADPLISTNRPASQRLIGGAIRLGYMQVAGRIFDGLRFLPATRSSGMRLLIRSDGEHCRYRKANSQR